MGKVIVKSLITALPVIFLLCITGLAVKIGFESILLYISIKLLLDIDLHLMFDFGGDK